MNNEKIVTVKSSDVVVDKLNDAMSGIAIEFDPDEADLAGAFREDALTMDDAQDGTLDNVTLDQTYFK